MKLSIITINYNNLSGLKTTCDSICSQSFCDFEWIIIDGGSTDGSKDFIRSNENLLAYWCSEHDNGVYDAMNKGIRYAKGDYLYFLNSGDRLYNSAVLDTIFRKEYNADIIYGDWIIEYQDKEVHRQFPAPFHTYHIYCRNICHQALFVKTTVMKNEGYDESYKIIADWARWAKLAVGKGSFEYVPITVCYYDGYGMSSNNNCGGAEIERMRENIFPISDRVLFERFKNIEYNYWVNNALTMYERGKFKKLMLKMFIKLFS